MDDICKNCGGKIEIAIFKGTEYCCEWCKRGVARFRPEDEPIPELAEDIEIHLDTSLKNIDVANIIFEPLVNLSEVLSFCYENHIDPNDPDNVGQAFVHRDLHRICLNLYNRDVWVYCPEWDVASKEMSAQQEQHVHGPDGHTH